MVAYDLKLMINALVNKHWFSYDLVNELIDTFEYMGCDRTDKPVPLVRTESKLFGHAIQNWTLLRIFPILVYDYIKDTCDPVWHLCVQLHDIVELICAPVISKSQVGFLESSIMDYIWCRKKIFSEQSLKSPSITSFFTMGISLGPLVL